MDSTGVAVDWSPPLSNQTNGIITSYQLCYSTERLQESCTGNGTIWHIESAKTFVKSDGSLPATISVQTFVRLYGLLPATVYFFRIRARTEAGPGPYTKEYKTITSAGEGNYCQIEFNHLCSLIKVHFYFRRPSFIQ